MHVLFARLKGFEIYKVDNNSFAKAGDGNGNGYVFLYGCCFSGDGRQHNVYNQSLMDVEQDNLCLNMPGPISMDFIFCGKEIK